MSSFFAVYPVTFGGPGRLLRNLGFWKAFVKARQDRVKTSVLKMTYAICAEWKKSTLSAAKVVKNIQISCSTESLLFDSFFLDKLDDSG